MDILDTIRAKLEEQIRHVEDDLCHGAAKEYAEYRYICGIFHGMRYGVELIKDAKTSLEREE